MFFNMFFDMFFTRFSILFQESELEKLVGICEKEVRAREEDQSRSSPKKKFGEQTTQASLEKAFKPITSKLDQVTVSNPRPR